MYQIKKSFLLVEIDLVVAPAHIDVFNIDRMVFGVFVADFTLINFVLEQKFAYSFQWNVQLFAKENV